MDILGLLQKVDWFALVASAVTFIIGLSVIKPKLKKAVTLIGDLADLLSDIKASLEDGNISKEEAAEIVKEGQELIADFKK